MSAVPMRRCVVCRSSFPQQTLVRIYRGQDGKLTAVTPFTKGSKPVGRSAYVCSVDDCIEGLIERPTLVSQSLKAPMSSEDAGELRTQLHMIRAQMNAGR